VGGWLAAEIRAEIPVQRTYVIWREIRQKLASVPPRSRRPYTRWEFRLAAWLTGLTLLIALVGVYSPYVKLENKISTIREEVTHSKETDEELKTLKQEIQQLQQTHGDETQELDALDRRLKAVELRTPRR